MRVSACLLSGETRAESHTSTTGSQRPATDNDLIIEAGLAQASDEHVSNMLP